MKVTWEPEDIQPGRLMLSNTLSNTTAKNNMYLLGYRHTPGNKVYSFISLASGLITDIGSTEEDACQELNHCQMIPAEAMNFKARAEGRVGE